MFTGIVEEVGTVVVREDHADSAVLRIRAEIEVVDGLAEDAPVVDDRRALR